MSAAVNRDIDRAALAQLAKLVHRAEPRAKRLDPAATEALIAADLAWRDPGGELRITDAGRARLLRELSADETAGPFRSQHLKLARRVIATSEGRSDVTVDEAESPLAWLARRKGRDGEPLIHPAQFQAGERLRADFTRAQMTPRVTSSWDATATRGRGDQGTMTFSDTAVEARQQLRGALDALAPELSDLLLDVCCFLKGLEDVERERRWPPRSAKVVLQLGLDQLARHYGLTGEARGRAYAPIRTWLDADVAFAVES